MLNFLCWPVAISLLCAAPCGAFARDALPPKAVPIERQSSINAIRSVVVVAHGLNQKPATMRAIGEAIAALGAELSYVSLSGHRSDSAEFSEVSADKWLNEMRGVYLAARKRADELKVPLYLAAFSIGGLINLELIARSKGLIVYDKMLLFAPAISLPWYANLIKALYPFGNSFAVPSRSPPEYRAHSGTSIAAYKALFDLVASIKENNYRDINIPSLVFIDPHDECVSFSGLNNIIREFNLDNWRVFKVEKNPSSSVEHFHHLIIDEFAVGVDEWKRIEQALKLFLDSGE